MKLTPLFLILVCFAGCVTTTKRVSRVHAEDPRLHGASLEQIPHRQVKNSPAWRDSLEELTSEMDSLRDVTAGEIEALRDDTRAALKQANQDARRLEVKTAEVLELLITRIEELEDQLEELQDPLLTPEDTV